MQTYSKRFLYFICAVSAMGGLLFGYDWVVIGGAKPFYELFFGISHSPLMQGVAMTTALVYRPLCWWCRYWRCLSSGTNVYR